MIATIAHLQVLSLRRQRVFAAVVAIVVAMTAVAGGLGWSSHQTIVRVYDDAAALLAAQGQAAPPNPFELKPTLALLSNMVIYIPLIGALLALIVGHLTMADDQSSGMGRLIFTRRVRRTSYFAGKLAGASAVIAIALSAGLVVSLAALVIANGEAPGFADTGRLTAFYGLSWLYLVVFVEIGMVAVLLTSRRSLALLSGIGTWLVITFAVPQFTSGLRPTTSLNPITDPVSTSQTFFEITSRARPVSLSEQYKAASSHILQTATGDSTIDTLVRVVPIAVLVVALAVVAVWLVSRHDYSRSSSDD